MPAQEFEGLFPRLRRSQKIADDLKNMIGNGQLCAGRRIPTEAEMCRHYGVSRTTVREALQALRSNGVLDVTPGRGSYIRKPDPAPLFHEIALVLNACGISAVEAQELHHSLLRGLLNSLARSPAPARQELYQHIASRQATPAENAVSENRWHQTIAKLSGHVLAGHVMSLLLQITHGRRVQALGLPACADALAQAQLRLTTAICDSDFAATERLLPTLFNQPADLPRAA